MVLGEAREGRAAQLRADPGRFLPAQNGVQEFDGDDVREAGGRDLRQFLGGAHDVQGGPDADAGVVEQGQSLPGHLRAAGQGAQLGGVPQGHHTAVPVTGGQGDPFVEGEEAVRRQVHLVRGDPVRREQGREGGVEAQFGDAAALRVRRQVEQPARLVVGEEQPVVAAGDENALADRVQDGVVVFVHPGHLRRTQAVGLAAQPPAHEAGAEGHEAEGPGRAAQDDGQLLVERVLDLLDRDRGGDDGDHVAPGVPDRGRRDHGEAQGTLEGAREGTAGGGLGVRADDVLAELGGVAVGEGDSVELVDDQGVDAGRLAGSFGQGLELDRGEVVPEGPYEPRRVGEGLGGGGGPVPGVGHGVAAGLDDEGGDRGCDEEDDEYQLEDEDLAGDAAGGQPRRDAPASPGGGFQRIVTLMARVATHTSHLSLFDRRLATMGRLGPSRPGRLRRSPGRPGPVGQPRGSAPIGRPRRGRRPRRSSRPRRASRTD